MADREMSYNSISIYDFDTSETSRITNDERININTSKEKGLLKENNESTYKTELCRTWVEKNYCPYREKCRFAHGKKELHEKQIKVKNYKKKECNSFYKEGYCPYGPRCHFKHDDRKFHEIERIYYQFKLISNKMIEKYFGSLRIQHQDNNSQDLPVLPVFNEIHKQKLLKLNPNDTHKQKNNNKFPAKANTKVSPKFIPVKLIATNSKSRNNISISNKILDSYM